MPRQKRTPEEIAAKSVALRLELHAACNGDFSDKTVARELNRLLPNDTNRSRKLSEWKAHGLWPVPQHELDKGRAQGVEQTNIPMTDLPETPVEHDAHIEVAQPATTTESPVTDLDRVETALSLSNTESLGDEGTAQESCNMSPVDTSAPSLPDDLVEMLTTAHRTGDLEALLAWWRSEEGGNVATVKRPRFIGERVNSGLLVNRALKDRAFAKAKAEGMSLSQLVELLFWRYVGEPDEFIAHDE